MGSAGSSRTLSAAAAAAHQRRDDRELERLALELLALGERENDRVASAWGHHYVGLARMLRNDGVAGKREFTAARDLFEQLGDKVAASRSIMNLAMIALAIDVDAAAARRYFESAEPIVRQSGDRLRIARGLGNLGEILRLEGDYRAALNAASESLTIFHDLGEHARAAWQLTNIAHLHALRNDFERSTAALKEAWNELQVDPNPRWIAWFFDAGSIIAAKQLRWKDAARLLGFADHWRDEHSLARNQVMLPWLSEPKERMTQALEHDELVLLLNEGAALSPERAAQLLTR